MAVDSRGQSYLRGLSHEIDLILLDVLLYAPAVDVNHNGHVTFRVHGDKLIPLLCITPLSRILLMSATSPLDLVVDGRTGVLRTFPFSRRPFTKQALLDKVQAVLAGPLPALKPRSGSVDRWVPRIEVRERERKVAADGLH